MPFVYPLIVLLSNKGLGYGVYPFAHFSPEKLLKYDSGAFPVRTGSTCILLVRRLRRTVVRIADLGLVQIFALDSNCIAHRFHLENHCLVKAMSRVYVINQK